MAARIFSLAKGNTGLGNTLPFPESVLIIEGDGEGPRKVYELECLARSTRQCKFISYFARVKHAEKTIQYLIHSDLDELSKSDLELFKSAEGALTSSYSPYSNFKVGAAIRLADNQIVLGSNQENASFSLCVCAERNALFTVGSTHPNVKIHTIAVVAEHTKRDVHDPVFPCGACRQVICEYEDRQDAAIRILLKGANGTCLEFSTIRDLLPFAFKGSTLV